jgi:MraZ protein
VVISGETMLIGSFKNNIGDKNRVAFPIKFKNELGSSLIVTKGYENCLIIVDKSKFSGLMNSIKDVPFVNSGLRDTKRFLIGSAQEIELDKQGRFVIPQDLKKYASLGNECVFIGLVDWIELWDKSIWDKKEESINSNSSEISDKLSELLNRDK